MLTIKYIDENGETLLQADQFRREVLEGGVVKFTATGPSFDETAPHGCVGLWFGSDDTADHRTIYVMNSKGATVSVFHFGSDPHVIRGPSAFAQSAMSSGGVACANPVPA